MTSFPAAKLKQQIYQYNISNISVEAHLNMSSYRQSNISNHDSCFTTTVNTKSMYISIQGWNCEPVTASAGERPAADGVVGASSHWKDLRL